MKKPIQFEGRPGLGGSFAESHPDIICGLSANISAPKNPKILAVVKSNAYGLGAVPIAKTLQKAGTEWFGVTCANEGIELREAGIRKRILVLTGFWPGEEKRLIKHDLTMTVSRADDLKYLERAAKASRLKAKVPFHLKINTGMNRLGISPDEVDSFARLLSGCRHIQLEGTYTHFASAEDFTSGQTCEQEKLFLSCLDRLRKLGVSPGIVHMANSGAISARSETWADMVRPGAILYGYYQSFDPPEKKREVMGHHAARAVSRSPRPHYRAARPASGPIRGLRCAFHHQAGLANRRD